MRCTVCGKEFDPSYNYSEKVMVEHQMCFTCNFWRKMLEQDKQSAPHEVVIVDGVHYIVGDENSTSHFRGFGGRKFDIQFNDGTLVTTTNLWCQGDISPEWRDKFPDNAKFVDNAKWTNIRGTQYLL